MWCKIVEVFSKCGIIKEVSHVSVPLFSFNFIVFTNPAYISNFKLTIHAILICTYETYFILIQAPMALFTCQNV